MRSLVLFSLALSTLLTISAGSSAAASFDKPGHPISTGVYWASQVESLVRGPLDIANPGLGTASAGLGANALGPATGVSTDTVSLGDGGSITVSFTAPIGNGLGDDFAVFENGFFAGDELFAELAFVEVSSNGSDFARFPPETLATLPVASFATLDPLDYANLAGDQPASLGTGFDLDELGAHPLVVGGTLDLSEVRYVRIIDVIGDGSTFDVSANPIYDPYATAFPAGGFDLDAVADLQAPSVPVGPFAWFGSLLTILAFALRSLAQPPPPSGRRMPRRVLGLAFSLGFGLAASQAAAITANFDDAAASMGLASESFYNGADMAGGFTSGGAFFENSNPSGFWSGFSLSNQTDTMTSGFGNQYSAIPGSGALGTDAYGVSFSFSPSTVSFGAPVDLASIYVTNTTYAFLSMRDGDAFTDPFGGPSGDEPDFLTLTIEGFDASMASVGSIDFDLGDYRPSDNSLDTLIDAWTLIDLSSLQSVTTLSFSLAGSDNDPVFGLNTPAYFAIDELSFSAVPEPGTAVLLLLGLGGLARRRRALSAHRPLR